MDDDMKLPPGKTCADCVHLYRCTSLGYTSSPTNTWCDFGPSRFRLAEPDVAASGRTE